MKINILISTFNGSTYIREQLDSILAQSYSNIELLIRDDGSKDDTVNILNEYASKYKNIKIIGSSGNLGSSKSFLKLLTYSNADYVMFCDQDDFWLPEKVENARLALEDEPENLPLMAFSDLTIVDSDLNITHESMMALQKMDPCSLSQNYLKIMAQNPVAGCTMILNKTGVELINNLDNYPGELVHDHWIAANIAKQGKIIYINKSFILYRQHSFNQIGGISVNKKFWFNKLLNLKATIHHDSTFLKAMNLSALEFSKFITYKVILNVIRVIK